MRPTPVIACAAVLAASALICGCGNSGSSTSPDTPTRHDSAAPPQAGQSAVTPVGPLPTNVELCPDGGQITCSGRQDIHVASCTFDEARGSGSLTYTVTNPASTPVDYEASVTFNYTAGGVLYTSNARQTGTAAPGQSVTRTESDADNAQHGVTQVICDVFYTETTAPTGVS